MNLFCWKCSWWCRFIWLRKEPLNQAICISIPWDQRINKYDAVPTNGSLVSGSPAIGSLVLLHKVANALGTWGVGIGLMWGSYSWLWWSVMELKGLGRGIMWYRILESESRERNLLRFWSGFVSLWLVISSINKEQSNADPLNGIYLLYAWICQSSKQELINVLVTFFDDIR